MMRKNRYLPVALVLAAILPVQLSVAGDATTGNERDRAAIGELMWHYARALDTFNADAYVALFTEDGEFRAGQNVTAGHEALHNMMLGYRKDREDRRARGETVPAMYHMTTDSHIEFIDDEHALHHSYWITVTAPAGAGASPGLIGAGRGIDEVVRVDGNWLIRKRDVSPQD